MKRTWLMVTIIALSVVAVRGQDVSTADRVHARLTALEKQWRQARSGDLAAADVETQLLAAVDSMLAVEADTAAAVVLDWAGLLALQSGRLEEARERWDRGMSIARGFRDTHTGLFLRVLNSETIGYAASGNLEEATDRWLEAVDLRESIGDSSGMLVALANLGAAYSMLGRVPESVNAFRAAIDISPDPDEPRLSGSFAGLARCLEQLGQNEEALVWADSAVARGERAEHWPSVAVALVRRGQIRHGMGQSDLAMADLDYAIACHERVNDGYYRPFTETVRMRMWLLDGKAGRVIERAGALRAEAFEHEFLPIQLDEQEGLALVLQERFGEAEALFSRAIDDLERLRSDQVEEANQNTVFGLADNVHGGLAACRRAVGDLEGAWRAIELGRGRGIKQRLGAESFGVDADDLAHRLTEMNAALIEYSNDTVLPAGAIVHDGAAFRWADLGVRYGDLDADLTRVMNLLANGREADITDSLASRLTARLVGDALDGLPAGVERLIIVPPTAVTGFPFEWLPLPDGGRLGERYAVSYLPACGLLPTFDAAPTASGLLAFADPDVAEVTRSRYRSDAGRLPYARREAEHVIGKSGVVLVGAEANRDAFVSRGGEGAAVVHVAAHAVANRFRPESSVLLLAGLDGAVSAEDIEGLSFDCDLVTLSGCSTLGGGGPLGEGAAGLTRAFLLAGSRSVVSSLWDVEDESTFAFMTHVYDGLRTGKARDVALRDARRALYDAGYDSRDAMAFVLTGLAGEPVPALIGTKPGGGRRVPPVWISGAAALALLVIVATVRRRRAA